MVTGIGLSILWPRFLGVVLWTVMAILYYLLARDEERRMLGQFGEDYRAYMDRSGMFLPFRNRTIRAGLALLVLAVCAIGGAFLLRSYTVSRLPLWSQGAVTALPFFRTT